jgi:acyl carrier protein
MPHWLSIALIIGFLIAVAFIGDSDSKAKEKIKGLFQGRPARDQDEFYRKFFSNSPYSKELVSKVRNLFQELFDIDLSQLEADDDLSKDFNMIWSIDSMADVEIVISLEKEFHIKISDEEARNSKTLRDIIDLVYKKTEQGAAANP